MQHQRRNPYYQSIFSCVRVQLRTLYERCAEYAWSDQSSIVKNHFDQCVEMRYQLNITSLGPTSFSYDNNIGSSDNRNTRINLVIDNITIILR